MLPALFLVLWSSHQGWRLSRLVRPAAAGYRSRRRRATRGMHGVAWLSCWRSEPRPGGAARVRQPIAMTQVLEGCRGLAAWGGFDLHSQGVASRHHRRRRQAGQRAMPPLTGEQDSRSRVLRMKFAGKSDIVFPLLSLPDEKHHNGRQQHHSLTPNTTPSESFVVFSRGHTMPRGRTADDAIPMSTDALSRLSWETRCDAKRTVPGGSRASTPSALSPILCSSSADSAIFSVVRDARRQVETLGAPECRVPCSAQQKQWHVPAHQTSSRAAAGRAGAALSLAYIAYRPRRGRR